MNLLFVHQNFPAQYRHLAATLAGSAAHRVVALGDLAFVRGRPRIPGLTMHGYPSPEAASAGTHHYVRPLESAVRRGQAVLRACLDLRKNGFVPDVICAHAGWGEALFLRDVFPKARILLYCEFHYRARSADVGFDPEYPATADDLLRVRIKCATSLLSLDACDRGMSPTQWQRQTFPPEYRPRIDVAHEGVDTTIVTPDPDATLDAGGGVMLSARDEVVTYVARNLEPYRGFHVFMRALPVLLVRRPRAHVVIVGGDGVSYGKPLPDGATYRAKLMAEVGPSLDAGRVHFLGQVPYATLLRVYQVSRAHVYLTYPFVLSWSLLEAMAAGCAIVASRTPPVEEVVNDGENGRLFDFFSRDGLVAGIESVLDDAALRSRLGSRARATVIERYDLQSVCLPRQRALIGA